LPSDDTSCDFINKTGLNTSDLTSNGNSKMIRNVKLSPRSSELLRFSFLRVFSSFSCSHKVTLYNSKLKRMKGKTSTNTTLMITNTVLPHLQAFMQRQGTKHRKKPKYICFSCRNYIRGVEGCGSTYFG